MLLRLTPVRAFSIQGSNSKNGKRKEVKGRPHRSSWTTLKTIIDKAMTTVWPSRGCTVSMWRHLRTRLRRNGTSITRRENLFHQLQQTTEANAALTYRLRVRSLPQEC